MGQGRAKLKKGGRIWVHLIKSRIPGTDISSSMEQLLMKTRDIVNKNKQQKHVAFYSVVYACMYKFKDQIFTLGR
jgi:hypothetical protein